MGGTPPGWVGVAARLGVAYRRGCPSSLDRASSPKDHQRRRWDAGARFKRPLKRKSFAWRLPGPGLAWCSRR